MGILRGPVHCSYRKLQPIDSHVIESVREGHLSNQASIICCIHTQERSAHLAVACTHSYNLHIVLYSVVHITIVLIHINFPPVAVIGTLN